MLKDATHLDLIPMTQRILITGGAGFIGSHLCDRFLAEGFEVVCLDNFLSGRQENIAHLRTNPHFTLVEHDLCQPLPDSLGSFSAILHFASPASPSPDSPVSYFNHPVETFMVNTLGTQRLLELAEKNHCQIILASTSEVYGDPAVHPQPETYWGNVSPNGPRSCYDEGKRGMEALAFSYYRQFKTKIKVIRIFNTYGPRMRLDDGRFIPTLIRAVVTGEPFTRFGTGSATRSFCYIDDLVAGIFQVFQTEATLGQVLNLGNNEEFVINDVLGQVEVILGKKINITPREALPDDPAQRRPDLTRAKKMLHWTPKITLHTGLKKMLEYYV